MAKGTSITPARLAEQIKADPHTLAYMAKAPAMWGKVLTPIMDEARKLAAGRRVAFEAQTFVDNLAGRRLERLDFTVRLDAPLEDVVDFDSALFNKFDYGKLHEQTKERLLPHTLPWR
jgi:hypothetical protein